SSSDCLVNLILTHRQRRTEADRALAAGQHDHPLDCSQMGDHGIAVIASFEVKGDEQTATADVTDQPRVVAKALQSSHQLMALRASLLDETLGLDDLQCPARADHVDEP